MIYIFKLILLLFVINCENLKFEDFQSLRNLDNEIESNILPNIFETDTLTNQPIIFNTIESNNFHFIDYNSDIHNLETTFLTNLSNYTLYPIYLLYPSYLLYPTYTLYPVYLLYPTNLFYMA